MCLENEVGLIASAHFEQRHFPGLMYLQDLAPKKGTDGMTEVLTELCIDLQDMPHSYAAHQREFSED